MTVRSFTQRTVVVTGAAGGLGRSLCLRFAAAGARIAALDLDPLGLQSLDGELAALGADFFSQTCDITDELTCMRAMLAIKQRFGQIDVLINNAGISHRSLLAQTAPQVIRKVMAVNFFGALHCTHAALPALRQSRGQIIVISSVAGFSPLIGRTGYAASKHALHGFFDSLRPELAGAGVGVTLVCPGAVDTPIREATEGGGRGSLVGEEAAGAMMSAAECARLVLDAARAGRRQLLMTLPGKLGPWVRLLVPGLIDRVLVKRLGL
jgi:NAD(P)-dependent dehydrogenase (short-subunit alcohol dehydrogenase family)